MALQTNHTGFANCELFQVGFENLSREQTLLHSLATKYKTFELRLNAFYMYADKMWTK